MWRISTSAAVLIALLVALVSAALVPLSLSSDSSTPAPGPSSYVAMKLVTLQKHLSLALVFASSALAGPTKGHGNKHSGNLPPGLDLLTATVQELSERLSNGSITSVDLTQAYLDRWAPLFPLVLLQ